jgi:hypothetical protein
MKVVGHQTIGVDLPTGFFTNFPERLQKALSVLGVGEYFLAPVAPVHEVIKRARVLDPKLAWHGRIQIPSSYLCQ